MNLAQDRLVCLVYLFACVDPKRKKNEKWNTQRLLITMTSILIPSSPYKCMKDNKRIEIMIFTGTPGFHHHHYHYDCCWNGGRKKKKKFSQIHSVKEKMVNIKTRAIMREKGAAKKRCTSFNENRNENKSSSKDPKWNEKAKIQTWNNRLNLSSVLSG